MSATIDLPIEQRDAFACFGSRCTVIVADDRVTDARDAVARAHGRLLEWHAQFSRFQPDSELTRLNQAPEEAVAVSPMMRRVLDAAVRAAHATGGLVDPTLLGEIERAGYDSHFEGEGLPLAVALALAPERAPGRPAPDSNWRRVRTDRRAGTVTRPPGVRIDPGGIAKGVFADELASLLSGYGAFVVDCGGDMRLGGRLGLVREVHVASPFDDSTLHTFAVVEGRGGHQRGGAPELAGPGRTSGTPSARSRERPAGVHRHRPGDRARARPRPRRRRCRRQRS